MVAMEKIGGCRRWIRELVSDVFEGLVSERVVERGFGSVEVAVSFDECEEVISSFSDVTARYEFLQSKPKEHLYALFLGSTHEVLGDKLICIGGAGGTPVDVIDIARTAVVANASAVVLVHNHPGRGSNPSMEDMETTEEVQEALELFDIELLDHVILAWDGSYSMRHDGDCLK